MQYYDEETKLPENFADSVLELEIKLDSEECDLPAIQRLNELYRVSINHYAGRYRILHHCRQQEVFALSEKTDTAFDEPDNPQTHR
jgi:hypothetical protein